MLTFCPSKPFSLSSSFPGSSGRFTIRLLTLTSRLHRSLGGSLCSLTLLPTSFPFLLHSSLSSGLLFGSQGTSGCTSFLIRGLSSFPSRSLCLAFCLGNLTSKALRFIRSGLNCCSLFSTKPLRFSRSLSFRLTLCLCSFTSKSSFFCFRRSRFGCSLLTSNALSFDSSSARSSVALECRSFLLE